MAADIKRYATVNELEERHVGIPFPGTFVVDPQGRVVSRSFEDYYRERSTASSMMIKLGAGGAPVTATHVSSTQLDLTTYPSDAAVAPGNRFVLVLDIAPRPGMHVYAPGASGYRVITLSIRPQPFVRVLPLEYAASETYFFEPLEERVPVYQKPFTLVQELVLEVTPEAQAALTGKDRLVLTGTLDYQACDDKICFNPVSVPLSWTLGMRRIVTERPSVPR